MGVFNFDAVAHEASRTPFEFDAGGKRWRLPHITDLTVGQQLAADRGLLHALIPEVAEVKDGKSWRAAGDEAEELILGKHADQLGALQAAWLAHAGVEPGESQASSR